MTRRRPVEGGVENRRWWGMFKREAACEIDLENEDEDGKA